jgi:hypothetical protein
MRLSLYTAAGVRHTNGTVKFHSATKGFWKKERKKRSPSTLDDLYIKSNIYQLNEILQKAMCAWHQVFRSSWPVCADLQSKYLFIIYFDLPHVFPVYKTVSSSRTNQISFLILQHNHFIMLCFINFPTAAILFTLTLPLEIGYKWPKREANQMTSI